MNTLKKDSQPKKKKERSNVSKSLTQIFSGNFLSKENTLESVPFVLFLTLMGLVYIANGYYAEKTVRELHKVGNELKELRSEYITIKSDLNYKSKQSQVAQSTENLGIKESTTPPIKIVITPEEMKTIGGE